MSMIDSVATKTVEAGDTGVTFVPDGNSYTLVSPIAKVVAYIQKMDEAAQNPPAEIDEMAMDADPDEQQLQVLSMLASSANKNIEALEALVQASPNNQNVRDALSDAAVMMMVQADRRESIIKSDGESGYMDTMNRLIKAGVDVNAPIRLKGEKEPTDLLHIAANKLPLDQAAAVMDLLKQAGADATKKDANGKTADELFQARVDAEAEAQRVAMAGSKFVSPRSESKDIADKTAVLSKATGMEWHIDEKNKKVWADVPNAAAQSAICNSLAFYGVSGVFGKTEDNHSTVAITFRALKEVGDESLLNAGTEIKAAAQQPVRVKSPQKISLSKL